MVTRSFVSIEKVASRLWGRQLAYASGAFLILAASPFIIWPRLASRFLTTGYLPHLYCYLAKPGLVWTHVTADSLIGLAYVAISVTLAYLVYRVGPGLRRADVVTREIADSADLLTLLRAGQGPTPGSASADPATVWDAVGALVHDLGRLGAVHADLNVRNVLIAAPTGERPLAYALDVDRVVWRRPGDPAVVRANWARLHRSARKVGLA